MMEVEFPYTIDLIENTRTEMKGPGLAALGARYWRLEQVDKRHQKSRNLTILVLQKDGDELIKQQSIAVNHHYHSALSSVN
ncbi:hypothetical protein Hanom_Chr02g00147971 [Helianthus anomalus]